MTTPPVLDLGSDMASELDLEFIYVADPMCSWCWGFAPVVERLQRRYAIPVGVVMGGLRTGPQAQPMSEALRNQMGGYWARVEEQTRQPFTRAALDRDGWRYDTEPSCRAVVAMRELAPHETLRWLERLQRAFYVEGADVTNPEVFPSLVEGFDIDADEFAAALHEDGTIERTQQDFHDAQRLGAMGFPTLLLRDREEHGIITRGFVSWEELEPSLTSWFERRYGDTSAGLICDPRSGEC